MSSIKINYSSMTSIKVAVSVNVLKIMRDPQYSIFTKYTFFSDTGPVLIRPLPTIALFESHYLKGEFNNSQQP